MERTRSIYLIGLLILALSSCKDDTFDLYERPNWLTGKIYTQLKQKPDLSYFSRCLELTGYDKIVDISGSYTVFAPNNEAIEQYLLENSYNSVEDIPLTELSSIVKYMIVQNPWSKQQLQSLDIYGWIDTTDINNNKAKGFKRQTLLLEDDFFLGVKYNTNNKLVISDSATVSWHRRVISDTRKYVPLFFREYFNVYNLKAADYEFYFGRSLDNLNDIYFAGAKIIGEEIFADNGFIYEVDKVVKPLKNSYEILNDKTGNENYSEFLEQLYEYPVFQYNQKKTFAQPDAQLGLEVDSLFDLYFPSLAFNITSEDTKAPVGTTGLPNDVAIRYHHGIIAPNNQAFEEFLNEYIAGPEKWGNLNSAPENIRRIIVNSHLSSGAVYPTDFQNGFKNGESDKQFLDPSTIKQKEFGSNCTFIGVNKAIVPRAFKSVTGPIYLLRGYSTVMNAVEYSGLLSVLKRDDADYRLFVESDQNMNVDSFLVYNSYKKQFSSYILSPEPDLPANRVSLSVNDIRSLLLNHIAIEQPTGIPEKEFIRNMAGSHLIFNNLTGEVSGTAPTKFGLMGSEIVQVIPEQISENADNGITYHISNWFSFSTKGIYTTISGSYPSFHQLLLKAGLVNTFEYRYTFMQENMKYTMFIPSDQALLDYQADTLNVEDLKNFLLMHFVTGDLIFTDGRLNPGYYITARIDEKSTTYSKVYTKIYIEPGIDVITFPDKSGTPRVTVPLTDFSNIITSKNIGEEGLSMPLLETTGLIHKIDKVLVFDELNTK